MYKIDSAHKILPKNVLELNKPFVNKTNNSKIDSIKSFTNYLKKLNNI